MHITLAEKLYDNQAIVIVEPIADYRHCLYQSELLLIQDVSEKRILEFSTGRDCAHQALHKLGFEACPILKGAQREPVWPEEIAGSISHCHDLAGAAAADKKYVKSLGLDIETKKELNPAIARHICKQTERTWLSAQDPIEQNLLLLLIFSLKEAVFKCVYQATQHKLQFKQCEVIPEVANGVADVKLDLPKPPPEPSNFSARFQVTDNHVYAGVLWLN